MGDTFQFKDYWPQPTLEYSLYQDWGINYDGKGLGSIFAVDPKDPNTIWIDDVHDGKWTARWYMNYDTPRGILEYADAYPKKKYQIFSDWNVVKFVKGKEIIWGGTQKVGDKIDGPVQFDPFRSTFPTIPTRGHQWVEFVGHYSSFTARDGSQYKDVVEIAYDQQFGNKTAGARYWFAKGIGHIQLSWRYNKADLDASMKNPLVAKYTKIDPVQK